MDAGTVEDDVFLDWLRRVAMRIFNDLPLVPDLSNLAIMDIVLLYLQNLPFDNHGVWRILSLLQYREQPILGR